MNYEILIIIILERHEVRTSCIMLKHSEGNRLSIFVDITTYSLMWMWSTCVSYGLACYVTTTIEKTPVQDFINYVIIGPVSFLTALLITPISFWALIIRLAVYNTFLRKSPFLYAAYKSCTEPATKCDQYTIATANVCLLREYFACSNNLPSTYKRALRIARRLLCCDKIDCDKAEGDAGSHILDRFPELDFICLQEVWDKCVANILISKLKERFSYFIYDVGVDNWEVNRYLMKSGLMFCSRFPIIDADFKCFKRKNNHGKYVCIGILLTKVDLSDNSNGQNKVGLIAVTHLQAYQGTDFVQDKQLDEALYHLNNFRTSSVKENEWVAFDFVCGDFNFDNMSPGDRTFANHKVFNEYIDYARVCAGQDCSWAIGTEMRQLSIWNKDIDTPKKFKAELDDPIRKRIYLLDADIHVQTKDLCSIKPPIDREGRVIHDPHMKQRRIDYILYRSTEKLVVNSYNFISALNQLTDHIPVTMTFSVKTS